MIYKITDAAHNLNPYNELDKYVFTVFMSLNAIQELCAELRSEFGIIPSSGNLNTREINLMGFKFHIKPGLEFESDEEFYISFKHRF